ncbi:hypothetical protein, partial [Ralstonia pseudosolanacearum]
DVLPSVGNYAQVGEQTHGANRLLFASTGRRVKWNPALPDWVRLPRTQAVWRDFHGQRKSKYVSSNGGSCEAVYGRNRKVVTDPFGMASYNYCGRSNALGCTICDVSPYIVLGNTLDDQDTILDRIMVPIKNRSANDE